MHATLAESIEVLLPHLVPTLVSPDAIPGLKALASHLMPVLRGGFECRLGADTPQVDLQQCLVPNDPELQGLQAAMATAASTAEGAARESWSALQHFVAAWAEPSSRFHHHIPEIWLEFDNDHTATGLPLPAIFFGLPQDVSPATDTYEIAAQSLHMLLGQSGWPAWQDNLAHCFTACPAGVFISHIGVMLSRHAPALRVNVKRLQPSSLVTYLQHIGWPGATCGAKALMQQLLSKADRLTICLDVGQHISPRLGFECIFLPQPQNDWAQNGWALLLDDLVRQGLCIAEKREALLKWPGQTTPVDTDAPWPGHLIADSLLRPTSYFTAFDRRLSHIKISWQPHHSLEAKAYIWFQHYWMSGVSAR